jgi:hypothetical protein
MVILISQDTSTVGLLVYSYINITVYICYSPTADVSSDIDITID